MRKMLTICLGICLMVTAAHADPARVRLATTTSTDNSGLLEELAPPFEKMFDVKLDIIAVGTGKALRLGESGDVDVVLVHAKEAELRFIAEGYGVNRREVMHNDFVILGPKSDPAGIRGQKSAGAALNKIAESESPFVSRGDDSGTHKKEKQLWTAAGVKPSGSWYRESGQGMGAVLTMANDMQAYTLADRGTWLAFKDKLGLEVLAEGDPSLYNPYGVIAVSPAKHPHVNYFGAMQFIAWLTSQEGQTVIRNFRIGGEALFHPDAIPEPAE